MSGENKTLHPHPTTEWYVMRITYQRELVAQRLLD
jgi:hypothetical protein